MTRTRMWVIKVGDLAEQEPLDDAAAAERMSKILTGHRNLDLVHITIDRVLVETDQRIVERPEGRADR